MAPLPRINRSAGDELRLDTSAEREHPAQLLGGGRVESLVEAAGRGDLGQRLARRECVGGAARVALTASATGNCLPNQLLNMLLFAKTRLPDLVVGSEEHELCHLLPLRNGRLPGLRSLSWRIAS